MYKIRKRLGGVRYQQLSDLLQQALREHQAGDNSLHREWISILLSDYYDPMYDYQMTLKKGPVEFRGTAAEITEYLA